MTIYVISICTLGIFSTFLTDWIQNAGFFGDTLLEKPETGAMNYDRWYQWGPRHYWYSFMCWGLFILSIAKVIVWGNNYFDKKV